MISFIQSIKRSVTTVSNKAIRLLNSIDYQLNKRDYDLADAYEESEWNANIQDLDRMQLMYQAYSEDIRAGIDKKDAGFRKAAYWMEAWEVDTLTFVNIVEDQELEARISHDSSCMEYRLSSYSIQVVNELDTISKTLEDRREKRQVAANELNKKLDEQ